MIYAALHVPAGEEAGYGQLGDYARRAVLEKLARDEAEAKADPTSYGNLQLK